MSAGSRWDGRRVLVTGATGIVGSWLCEALLERGAAVVALVLDDDPQSRFYSGAIARSCSIVRGNLADIADCARAVNSYECETIFHLGAQTIVGTALRDPLECFESNIRGTYNLLEAARRLQPLVKAFVVASTDKAYGEAPVLPYTEAMPLAGKHPYDVSKSCADLLAAAYHHTYGLPVTIARCGNIYGGGDLNWSRIVPGTIRSLLRGERPVLRSDGAPVRDYIYVKDAVDAYIALAEATDRAGVAGEAFNFGTQSGSTAMNIVETIARVMHVEANPVVLDAAPMEIREQTLDAGKARARLDWRPRWSLEDGLHETVAWYRTHLSAPLRAAR
ncbi:MAG: CDP-glucose 4,6-dehydratase [Candidatus Eremiobacteraeota bacterium]|jgi:CDP-glucose 4,6-dehydratase|nr:CDP-glucose 4,6-dehydratase [Candidatus Eremiobacteraeota bacterium]